MLRLGHSERHHPPTRQASRWPSDRGPGSWPCPGSDYREASASRALWSRARPMALFEGFEQVDTGPAWLAWLACEVPSKRRGDDHPSTPATFPHLRGGPGYRGGVACRRPLTSSYAAHWRVAARNEHDRHSRQRSRQTSCPPFERSSRLAKVAIFEHRIIKLNLLEVFHHPSSPLGMRNLPGPRKAPIQALPPKLLRGKAKWPNYTVT